MPVKMMMMVMIIGKQVHSRKKLQKYFADFSNHVQKLNSELKLQKIFTM